MSPNQIFSVHAEFLVSLGRLSDATSAAAAFISHVEVWTQIHFDSAASHRDINLWRISNSVSKRIYRRGDHKVSDII